MYIYSDYIYKEGDRSGYICVKIRLSCGLHILKIMPIILCWHNHYQELCYPPLFLYGMFIAIIIYLWYGHAYLKLLLLGMTIGTSLSYATLRLLCSCEDLLFKVRLFY